MGRPPSHPWASPPPQPSHWPVRLEWVTALLAVILLAAAVFLPWWMESETEGNQSYAQTFSPLNGVAGSCTPACPAYAPGPATGAFSKVGLNATGELYQASLACVVVGVLALIAGIVTTRPSSNPPADSRRARWGVILREIALLATAAGASLLPLLQPGTLNSDASRTFGDAWTASPSPETSFWGGCSAAQNIGTCAYGGSAVWGPALGWDLLVVATILLVALLVLTSRRRRAPPPQVSPGPWGPTR